MQVTKEGIERIKAANELAAVVAERGIELKKKGRVARRPLPLPPRSKTPSFTITPSKGLFHCFGCGAAGDVIGFVTKHDKVSFGEALEILAKRAGPRPQGADGGAAPRPAPAPAEALTAPPATDERQWQRRTPPGAPPAAALLARVVEHYHRTFCEREDAQAYLVKQRGLTDLDLLRALKVGYADGSLLKVIPKNGELRDQLRRARRHHARGPRAARRLCRRPDPRPAHRRMDEPLRPRAEDAAPLLPAGPAARRPELPGRAVLVRGRPHRVASSTRSASIRPASRRRSRSTAPTASPPDHLDTAEARGREARDPRSRQRRRRPEGDGLD